MYVAVRARPKNTVHVAPNVDASPYHDLHTSLAGLVLKSIVRGCPLGGGTQLKISRNESGRSKIFACIAGLRVMP